ncbi:MAG: M1 family metallopeptidase, partial [Bacteroidota bacterium]
FQPGSMMDIRSRTISDPDRRVGSRISTLGPDEIGYHRIERLEHNGSPVSYEVSGTILEVTLNEPIKPGKTAKFHMRWNSQVPIQIRRSGRDNSEGIDYSMAQWYPKLAEYDHQGWNANPYVGREFHGVWGDFDVEIKINGRYTVAAGGTLRNAKDIGRGYSDRDVKIKDKKVTWKWRAENVHDFVWAADRDYVVKQHMTDAGVNVYYVYQPNERTTKNWEQLPEIMNEALTYMNRRYGLYPYDSYAFIQGGDGGMEYPMATLITGERNIGSLVGVSIHEWMHSWYQMLLATNEALYSWMDEGFTSFASAETMNHLRREGLIPGEAVENPLINSVNGLIRFNARGYEEPLSMHSDHFNTNSAYGVGAYTKGAVCLEQLKYIIGERAMYRGLKDYFNTWKFKHPTPNDFFRIMELNSDIELDWFKEYFVYTTHYPDYAVKDVAPVDGGTNITLQKIGRMPMPLDVVITTVDGAETYVNIPLRMMRGNKPNAYPDAEYRLAEDWPWTNPEYVLHFDGAMNQIQSIVIDPSGSMLDTNRDNNTWTAGEQP